MLITFYKNLKSYRSISNQHYSTFGSFMVTPSIWSCPFGRVLAPHTAKIGLFEKYGNHQALEVHVKDFMLNHTKMLGLGNPNDIRFYQELKIEAIKRLNNLKR